MKKIVISNLKHAILEMEPSKETLFLLGKVSDRIEKLKGDTIMYVGMEAASGGAEFDEADVAAYLDENFDELFKEAAAMAYEDLLTYEEEDEEE